jgi:hypothetical protein
VKTDGFGRVAAFAGFLEDAADDHDGRDDDGRADSHEQNAAPALRFRGVEFLGSGEELLGGPRAAGLDPAARASRTFRHLPRARSSSVQEGSAKS